MTESIARRVLVSVSDKTGITDFVRGLVDLGFSVVSTGGTRRHLAEAGIEVTDIAEVTGFPEMMDGRVKTLHPLVHGAILGRPDLPGDSEAMTEHGISPFGLVVCNLYPFVETISRDGITIPEAIEQIDIGGPSMIRSAAKNHAYLGVVTRADQYHAVLADLRETGTLSLSRRRQLAGAAFEMTAQYDRAISDYFIAEVNSDEAADAPSEFPERLTLNFERVTTLRSGENPHQQACLYREPNPAPGELTAAEQLNGKELSFNNLFDLDAALLIARDFDEPFAAVLKHTNPCGAAIGETLADAYERAHAGDPISAFGSIIGLNRSVDAATAEKMAEPGQFIEAIIAPDFDTDALEILTTKPKWRKNVRLMRCPGFDSPVTGRDYRRISGGLLVQDRDQIVATSADGIRPESWEVVTEAQPDAETWRDLDFVWRVTRHVKSNAIVFAKGGMVTGVGAGQMSRLDSSFVATHKSQDRCRGGVLGSDAFFPFRDGIDQANEAGIRAVIQPGGSVKDDEVIAACNEHGISMVFTGRRHFRH